VSSEASAARGGIDRRELLALLGLLALAAVLRLPNLATRGTWDGDQGHDMLVLRALVRDGIVPLLGPPTSIGDVHHGAWYYYLLSPAAYLTGGDSPLAVVSLIAAAGIAAVGVVWWLGRSIGGPVAGLAAAFVIATSAAAIDESTFIWNPNLIALSSAVALAGTWRAWSGGRAAWWVVATIGLAITMQCHVLGVAMLPIVGVPFILDARRRPLGRVAIVCLAVLALAYLPLAINEATTGFSEVNAAIDYVTGGRDATDTGIPVRFGIIGLRVVSWPLVGLVTEGFIAAVVVTCVVIGIIAWAWRRDGDARTAAVGEAAPTSGSEVASAAAPSPVGGAVPAARSSRRASPAESTAARWFGLGLLWSTAFLTVAAPSLASVVPGLPNDHYHAFADPMVYAVVGIGAAIALRGGAARPAGIAAIVAIVALAGWNLTHMPPAVNADRGFPAGQAAADRADAALSAAGVPRDSVVLVRSLPDFKSTEAMAYPLARLGRAYIAETPKGVAPGSAGSVGSANGGAAGSGGGQPGGLILLCDDRFSEAIGASCGGDAESTITPDDGGPASGSGSSAGSGSGSGSGAGSGAGSGSTWGPLLDRFEAAPGRFVSVYGPASGG
jgi:4-amino-4-deoxy-L-arabinose transferase-like glycosyltransferase